MDLQVERSELMMKPKRTAEENKRLAELVANENEWEMPLEKVQKEYLEYLEEWLYQLVYLNYKRNSWKTTKKASTNGTMKNVLGNRKSEDWDSIRI